jgi:hypothetical protein
MNETNDMVLRGDLTEFVPIPTGFDPLDGLISGGLFKTELVLLGGAQAAGIARDRLAAAAAGGAVTDPLCFEEDDPVTALREVQGS